MELFIHSFHHYDLYSTASPSSRITCTISSTYFTHNSSLCVSTITRITYSGLLAVEHISVATPLLIDILIANRGHTYLDALPLHRFERSHVGHDRGNHRIILQTATFLQILPTYIQDIIPVHFHTVLIHGNTPIRISVKRKSAIQILLPDKSLQIFDMCRSTSHIDVGTVRLIANHICFGTKRIKHTLCNIKRTSIGAIQPHSHPIVRSGSQRNHGLHMPHLA